MSTHFGFHFVQGPTNQVSNRLGHTVGFEQVRALVRFAVCCLICISACLLPSELQGQSESNTPESVLPQTQEPNLDDLLPPPVASTPSSLLSTDDLSMGSANDSPQDKVWKLILDEFQSSNEVRLLELRIKSLLEYEIQKQRQQAEVQAQLATQKPENAVLQSTAESMLPNPSGDITSPESGPVESEVGADQVVDSTAPTINATTSKRILSTPPDRLALADSLFLSGDSKVALELYQSLEGKDIDTWIRFQIGCCYRRMNQWDSARDRLRDVAESDGQEPWIEGARWWLDIQDRKLVVQKELDTIENFIEAKKNELKLDRPTTAENSRPVANSNSDLRTGNSSR